MSAARELTLGLDKAPPACRAAVVDGGGTIVGLAYREIGQRYPIRAGSSRTRAKCRTACARWSRARSTRPARPQATSRRSASPTSAARRCCSRTAARRSTARHLAGPAHARALRQLMREGVSPRRTPRRASTVARAEPRHRTRAGSWRLGTVDSWLAHWLTGDVHVSDHSNHSVSGVYDFLQGRYDERARSPRSDSRTPACRGSPTRARSSATTRPEILGAAILVARSRATSTRRCTASRASRRAASKLSLGTSA